MSTFVALLRGINVGGNKKIAMAELRDMAAGLKLDGAATLLQSGNLLFTVEKKTAAALEKLLEAETRKRFGTEVDFVVRSAAEWEKIVERNPFSDAAKNDPSHLVVMALKQPAESSKVKALQSAIKGREVAKAAGSELYITYPNGIGDSKLTNSVIEKHVGTRGTARNWNTVLKIQTLAAKIEAERGR